MDFIEYIGLLAASIGTLAYLPQVVKTLRMGTAHDFSVTTLLMLEVGAVLWLIYGFYRHAIAIAFGNGVIFVLATIIMSVKVRDLRRAAASRRA